MFSLLFSLLIVVAPFVRNHTIITIESCVGTLFSTTQVDFSPSTSPRPETKYQTQTIDKKKKCYILSSALVAVRVVLVILCSVFVGRLFLEKVTTSFVRTI
jgi:hypothetical protein